MSKLKFRSDIDPDIVAVLRLIEMSGERRRVQNIRGQQADRDINKLETKIELLADEVERVIPRNHPGFWPVVIASLLRKASKPHQEEPDFVSDLEKF